MRTLTADTKIRLSQIKKLITDQTDANGMEHSNANGQFVSKNKNQSLAENIETILHGTEKQKEKLKGQYFKLNETPGEFKEIGLKGDFFQAKYGVISRHKTKDNDHSFSADEWRTICKNIADPKKCIITQTPGRKDFNIYTKLGKAVMVGVEIKSPMRNVTRNNIQTAYRAEPRQNEQVLYPKDKKNATSAQQSLLARLNPGTYTADTCRVYKLTLDTELIKSIKLLLNEL